MMWGEQVWYLKMSTSQSVRQKRKTSSVSDNAAAISELQTTPVDVPAECVRLIFSLSVSLVLAEGLGALWIRQAWSYQFKVPPQTHTQSKKLTNQSHCTEVSVPAPVLPFAPQIPLWLMTAGQPRQGDKDLTDIPVSFSLISLAWPQFVLGWKLSSSNDLTER